MAEIIPTVPAKRSGLRKGVWASAKIGLTVGLIVVVIQKVDWSAIVSEFSDIRPVMFAMALAVAVLNIYIQYRKWGFLVRIPYPEMPRRYVYASLLCGFSIGLITPGRLGELGKGLFLPGISRTQATGMSILDKVFSQLPLAMFGLLAIAYFSTRTSNFSAGVYVLCIALAGALFVLAHLILFRPQTLRQWIRRSSNLVARMPLTEKLTMLLSTTEVFKKNHFPPSLMYGVVFQLIIYLQTFLCVGTFHDVDVLPALAASAAAMFAKSLLPIAVMDLGVREGAIMFFFGMVAVPSSAALNGSLLLFLINVLIPGIMGLYYVWKIKHTPV
jgi:uncharacterized membrane protein YbhN (UPF0104 family)